MIAAEKAFCESRIDLEFDEQHLHCFDLGDAV